MEDIYESGGWFKPLAPALRDKILAVSTEKTFADGELIYSFGDHANASYVIKEGRVKICQLTPDGREFIIGLLDQFHCFGEQGVIDDSLRVNSAYALGTVRLLILPKSSLKRLRKENHEIAEAQLKFINYRLRTVLSHLNTLMFSPLQQQLAARLLLIARSNGKPTPNGIEIQAKLTQETLGKLTGASRQSINKELKELQKINLLEINDKKLTVLDMAGLEALSRDK